MERPGVSCPDGMVSPGPGAARWPELVEQMWAAPGETAGGPQGERERWDSYLPRISVWSYATQ